MSMRGKFEKLDNSLTRQIRQIEKQITSIYGTMNDELISEIGKAYSRYEQAGVLTPETMYKYDRIINLNREIAGIITQGNAEVRKELYNGLKRIYRLGFNESIGIIEDQAKRKIRGVAKPELINSVVQSRLSGIPLSDRIHRNTRESIYQIQQVVGQGIQQGRTYRQMAGDLTERIDIGKTNAERITRTEGHRVLESAKYEGLDHAHNQGVPLRKWWLDVGDERVRASHNAMGNKYSQNNAIPFEEDFVNTETGGTGPHPGALGTPEDDIHCRCLMIVEIDED